MAMRSEASAETVVEEEENYGPQPLRRLEVYHLQYNLHYSYRI